MTNNSIGDFVITNDPDGLWSSDIELGKFLNEAEATTLLLPEMLLIVDQALLLLEMFYVHMPTKRAMHATDPIQRLKLLKYQLDQMSEEQKMSQISFHSEMTRIFTSTRDRHTNYFLPQPYYDKIAFLPFQIEEYFESKLRKYIVSKLAAGLDHPTFKPGAEILDWNGVPIRRQIEINADRFEGSNPEARYALGLDGLTIRPMWRELFPDERWVVIGYSSQSGERLELKQNWLVISSNKVQAHFPNPVTKELGAQGIDIDTYIIQQTKKALFAPDVLKAQRRIASGEISNTEPTKEGCKISIPEVLEANELKTPSGTYGYLRIFTFEIPISHEKFVNEVKCLVQELPQNGLIIDLRNNSGGRIIASERLLQLFTPCHIKPERAQFINTPLTYDLCRRNAPSPYIDLTPWFKTFEQAVQTGATYSQSFPTLLHEDLCNDIGQSYYGPVVLITDALCYSATDMFAAGFQDHKIGPILGTSGNTGAGGANVWEHVFLKACMEQGNGKIVSPFKSLPYEANMRVALRRTLRVNEREGMLIEDLGVIPDASLWVDGESKDVHEMTKGDLLNDNVDLKNHAARILSKMRVYRILASVHSEERRVTVKIETENISQLDVFTEETEMYDGQVRIHYRPQLSIDVVNNSSQFDLERPLHNSYIKVEGFKDSKLVAAKRMMI